VGWPIGGRSVQEEVGGDEAPLYWIDGEAELLEHREAQQDGVFWLAEHHPAGRRVLAHGSKRPTEEMTIA
jgi:hypothetical protein